MRARLISLFFILMSIPFYANAANTLPLEIINNTKIADENNVFILVKAEKNDQNCLMAFDTQGTGYCEPVYRGMNTSSYSVPLASLPSKDGKYQIFLPKVSSGRIYFSVHEPLEVYIDQATNKIVDPDGYKPRDPNYYTLYDKIEFTYNDYGVWLNPTAVDFFSLPIVIEQKSSTSGVTRAGVGGKRLEVFSQLQHVIANDDKTANKIWETLFINYHNKDNEAVLRFVAPSKATVEYNNIKPFDKNYLANKEIYGFDYTEELWNYYKTHTINFDVKEIAFAFPLDDYLFTGHVDENNNFIFVNQTGSYRLTLEKPSTSIPFFAGAVDTFDAENNTPKAVIVRQLTSAFEVGLLPAPDKVTIDRTYFEKHKAEYYQNSRQLSNFSQGPWFDLYSKALHSFGEEQPIYTFAYDDALIQDGTLHDPNANNPGIVTVILGDLTETTLPDPYQDETIYTIMPILGNNTEVFYKGQRLESNVPIKDVTIPFPVTMNGKSMSIYINPTLVKPYYPEADGIVVELTGQDSATVIFPGR